MSPSPWSDAIPLGRDLRLVVCDMDGTLLDGEQRIPDDFWAVSERLADRGIALVPASGRQYATLQRMFADEQSVTTFIAENGNLVVRDGEVDVVGSLPQELVLSVAERVRGAGDRDLGLVFCGRRSAYIERTDAAFVSEAERYYAQLEIADDLTEVDDLPLKLAVYAFDGAESAAQDVLDGIPGTHEVVVSGEHWADIMNPDVNKGVALRELQRALGVTPAQTAAFGDYLNDLEMLEAAELSFAMENAHARVKAGARFSAPSNRAHGVVRVLEQLLEA